MKNFIIILLLILFAGNIYSQNLDSLFTAFVNSRNPSFIIPMHPGTAENGSVKISGEKCGFGLTGLVRENFHRFSQKQQEFLKTNFSRPTLESSIVSPSGKFRIHFDRTGTNKPNYAGVIIPSGADSVEVMIDSLAAAFDYTYNYEINILGYNTPPSDNGEGGDNLYDIYVENLGNGNYGRTDWTSSGNTNIASYIYIDNDFIGNYNSFGIDAARATAAHEFHHAIQVGGYIFRSEDTYYHEVTSTAMEEFVYDNVNDYYAYIPGYFNNISRKFSSGSGYDFALWNIFLEKRFGQDLLRNIWERMSEGVSAISAISSSIFSAGSTFKEELNYFGQQIYLTNYRYEKNSVFEEARNYPFIKLTKQPTVPASINIPFANFGSNYYFLFIVENGSITDSVVSIVTNSDITGTVNFTYSFFTNSGDGGTNIVNNYYYKLSSDKIGILKQANIFNNEPIEGNVTKGEIEFPFPQPFSYSNPNHTEINIPVVFNETGIAYLNVYTVAMDLVYSGSLYISPGNQIKLKWNGLDKKNDKLPTGVYIYVTKSGDDIKKGKIVIYNE